MIYSKLPCNKCISAELIIDKLRPDPECIDCYRCKPMKLHKQYLESKRKYRPGKPINDLDLLMKQKYIYWGDTPKHIEVIKSLQYRTIMKGLKQNWFRIAVER